MIEPKGGELNYNLAYKNPLKFYDQVMTQDIIQHKVRGSKAFAEREQQRKEANPDYHKKKAPLELTVKQTKRKIGRILFAVQSKLTQLLQS